MKKINFCQSIGFCYLNTHGFKKDFNSLRWNGWINGSQDSFEFGEHASKSV